MSANNTVLQASGTNAGISLDNAAINANNGSVALIATNSITSSVSVITNVNTLLLDSTAGNVGTSIAAPMTFSAANFSATAANGSVYVDDTSTGNVAIVTPTVLNCCPTILNPNSASGTYFAEATNSNGTKLTTAAGVTITAPTVVVASTQGSVGTSTSSTFVVSGTNLTASAVNGSAYVSDATAAILSDSAKVDLPIPLIQPVEHIT